MWSRRSDDCRRNGARTGQGMERGIAQEKVWGIRNMIEVCQELGGTYDNTQFQVEMRYHLSQEEAGKYMKQYWK